MDDDALRRAVERHRQGSVVAAIALYEDILAHEPQNWAALRYLGLARFQVGDRDEGLRLLERVTEWTPDDAVAWSDLGRMRAVMGRLGEAIACFHEAVTADSAYADGWHNLGAARRQAGDTDGALAAYKQALALDPKRADTYLNIGNLLVDDNQSDNAIESFKRAALLDPKLAEARTRLAGELSGRGEVSDAEFVFRQAIALDRAHVQAWFGLGRTLEDLGQADEAERCYRRVLELRPGHAWALGQLLSLDGAAIDDGLLAGAKQVLGEKATPDAARALIGYGLGKALDRRGDHDAAFAVVREANVARRREAGPFEAAAFDERIERLIETFSADFFAARQGFGLATELPVLIVGMPRSGTTLTEQVLDRHPQAFGAGELPYLAELAVDMRRRVTPDVPWSEAVLRLREAEVRDCAEDYLGKLAARAPAGVLRISDKSPLNFHHLGLVALFYPNARVIHCRRNPIDTCLSIFFENFRASQTHATDLGDIVRYYRGYERLMAHWRRVLPLRMLELRYEEMVEDFEIRVRELLDFVGLSFDERCLDFHASDRPVQTPSRWQVRKPLYRSSLGRWRRYERHLATLVEAFPDAVDAGRE